MNRPMWIVAASGAAAGVALGQAQIRAVEVTAALDKPVMVAHAPGDAARLFVAEKPGRVVIVDLASGQVLPTPFLDIISKVKGAGGDRGFLGLAFDPEYQTNGHFYVFYTVTNNFDAMIERYTVTSGNPNLANPASAHTIWRYPRAETGHTSGWLAFRPTDGMLYYGAGDGGTGAVPDPINAAQSLDVLMGKMFRIDPSSDAFPSDPDRNYAIPAGNPFIGVPGAAEEIWAYGIRQPWRCSFDRVTGDLWIADVGQDAREELDFEPASDPGGHNYGWRCTEGTFCTGLSGCVCNGAGLTPPIHEYDQTVGASITGGYVYRGAAIPSLVGRYFFADQVAQKIWSAVQVGGALTDIRRHDLQLGAPGGIFVAAFGEDLAGELYLCDHAGLLCRVEAYDCYPDCDGSGSQDFFDFLCFQNAFAGGAPYADCDGSNSLDFFDFLCFQNEFAAGCP